MSFGKLLGMIALGVIGLYLAFKLVGVLLSWAIHAVLAIAVPVALIVAVVYVVYRVTSRKQLGSQGRRPLP